MKNPSLHRDTYTYTYTYTHTYVHTYSWNRKQKRAKTRSPHFLCLVLCSLLDELGHFLEAAPQNGSFGVRREPKPILAVRHAFPNFAIVETVQQNCILM